MDKGLQTPSNFWPWHNLQIQMWPPRQFYAALCVANETDEEVTFVSVGCAGVRSCSVSAGPYQSNGAWDHNWQQYSINEWMNHALLMNKMSKHYCFLDGVWYRCWNCKLISQHSSRFVVQDFVKNDFEALNWLVDRFLQSASYYFHLLFIL